MAQLVEQPPLIPEVHRPNPVIGKIYIPHLFTVNCIEKTKIMKTGPGMAHFIKLIYFNLRIKPNDSKGNRVKFFGSFDYLRSVLNFNVCSFL